MSIAGTGSYSQTTFSIEIYLSMAGMSIIEISTTLLKICQEVFLPLNAALIIF